MNLKNLLTNYEPSTPEEFISRRRMVDLLENSEYPFSRNSMNPGHFTASAFLLNSDNSKFMLMHHKKLDKWLQPGGHCETETNLLEVAIREAKEESGIENITPLMSNIFDLDVHLIPANNFEPAHFHFDVRFLLKTFDNDNLSKNDESNMLIWTSLFQKDYFEFKLEYSILRMIEKFKILTDTTSKRDYLETV